MSLERRERFETLERLGELRRRLEDLTRRYAGADDLGGWTPDLDIIDADSHFVLLLELPGVRPEDVELLEEGPTVILAGVRHPREGSYLRRERPNGHFQRIIELPVPVREGSAVANFKNGVLEVRLEKQPAGE